MTHTRRAWCRAITGLVLLGFTLSGVNAFAVGFRVLRAQVHWVGDLLLLDADAQFNLSRAAQDALHSSVPLTLVLRVQVLGTGNWLWDNTLADIESRHQLRYHPLARQFVATNLHTGDLESFPSEQEALRYIGRLRDFPILRKSQIDAASHGRVRAELDIESLPAPLRPLAYLSPSWRLNSDWFQWPLR